MTDNYQCSVQYIPYKEIVKQMQQNLIIKIKKKQKKKIKIGTIRYHPKKKRNDKNIIKNGFKNNRLKKKKN